MVKVSDAASVRVAHDRGAAVVCLAAIAVTHLTELPEKIEEAPYMAVLFCGLIGASVGLGIVFASGRDDTMVWLAAGAVAVMPLIGYVLSRSVGLPQLEDHVGDWLSPAGVVSIAAEAVLVALSATHLSRSPRGSGHSPAAANRG
jgi:hypothetical protein